MKENCAVIQIQSNEVKSLYPSGFSPISFESNTQSMSNAFNELLKQIQKTNKRIDEFEIILSTPWILSKTKTSNFHFPKPVNIDADYVSKTLEQERKEFAIIFKEANFDEIQKTDLDFVEQKVFETKINGYHVHIKKPLPAMTFTVSSSVSAISKTISTNISSSIQHYFGECRVSFHSGLLLAFIGLRYIKPELENGILVFTHGECTDITIFKMGIPHHFASLNFGTSSLKRILAKATKSTEQISESNINLFEKDELSAEEKEKLEPIISKSLAEWNKDLIEMISGLEEVVVLPKDIILFSSDNVNLFEKTLSNLNEQNTVTCLPLEIEELYKEGLKLVEFHK